MTKLQGVGVLAHDADYVIFDATGNFHLDLHGHRDSGTGQRHQVPKNLIGHSSSITPHSVASERH